MVETRGKLSKFVPPSTHESPLLPDDLMTEILLRVPVRSLLQLRWVCKSWKTLISNPEFVKQHRLATSTSMTHQRLAFPIVGSPIKMASCSVEPLFQDPSTPANGTCFLSEQFWILGSCNGLLCLCKMDLDAVQLWNPSMRIASKEFPLFSRWRNTRYSGFGYDHVSDKYKLFLATMYGNKTVTRILTFGTNGKANSWRVIHNFPCCPTRSCGIFEGGGGTLNWLAKKRESDYRLVIMSFDLMNETYCDVLLPDGVGENIGNPGLVVLNNCLSVSVFDSEKDHWVLWQMKEYGVQHSWTRLMVVPHIVQGVCNWKILTFYPHDVYHNLDWLNSAVVPLCISEDGVLLIKTGSRLVLYNPNDGSWDFPMIRDLHCHHQIHAYHESLVSPLF